MPDGFTPVTSVPAVRVHTDARKWLYWAPDQALFEHKYSPVISAIMKKVQITDATQSFFLA